MHLDSLSETPEREANRRKDDNAIPMDILPTTNLAMETLITIVSHIVALVLVEFRL